MANEHDNDYNDQDDRHDNGDDDDIDKMVKLRFISGNVICKMLFNPYICQNMPSNETTVITVVTMADDGLVTPGTRPLSVMAVIGSDDWCALCRFL